jgi:hypothetical protein
MESLLDGTLSLEHIALLNDAAAVRADNRDRINKPTEN